MRFCQPCRDVLKRHQKAARRVAFFIALSLFLTGLGMVSKPVNEIGFCLVYP